MGDQTFFDNHQRNNYDFEEKKKQIDLLKHHVSSGAHFVCCNVSF